MFKQLMVQGTTSDAGKSTLCTALCYWLAQHQVRVAPFKPQNMALNSAVCLDGGEIGRAQAVQAQAAGIDCLTDMNPVLLKPNSDTGSQVIIQGKAVGNMDARSYHDYKKVAMQAVLHSYQRLAKKFQCIVIEGAGSPAEINLRRHDIANMGFAEAVDCPVIIVADIHPGGVFAQLYGTLALLSDDEQQRVIGFVINRFRGDKSLLQSGIDWLEQKTGKPVFGVLPWLDELYLDAEDSMNIQTSQHDDNRFSIVIPRLARMSNHTDFDPLFLHPGVNLRYAALDDANPQADLIILPGSKSVISDCQDLLAHGWREKLQRHLRYGGKVIGICGGLQMLGQIITDPLHIEGSQGEAEALGLLDLQTQLQAQKTLLRRKLRLNWTDSEVHGYEIHSGVSSGSAFNHACMRDNEGEPHGVLSADGQILATYLHGLFDQAEACADLLNWAGYHGEKHASLNQIRQHSFQRLGQWLQDNLDMNTLISTIKQFEKTKEVTNERYQLDYISQQTPQ